MALDRDGILQARRHTQKYDIANFGEVYLRILTMAEVRDWEKAAEEAEKKKKGEKTGALVKLLVLVSLSDEDGRRLFKDEDAETLAAAVPWPAMQQLFDEAVKLNKLGKEEKATEAEAAKN